MPRHRGTGSELTECRTPSHESVSVAAADSALSES